MRINVDNLQEVIKKSTLNYLIPSVQFTVDGDKVKSKMRSSSNDVVILLDMDNDVISDLPDSVEFNFDEPNAKVKPYLNLIDGDNVEATITDEKITLKAGRHKTDLFFCMSNFVTTFGGDEPKPQSFHEIDLTDEVKECFDKIKKVGGTFEKVYFGVKGGKLFVETTNRLNRFANGIKFDLDDTSQSDLDICFSFKNFNSVLQVIDPDFNNFKMKFIYMAEQQAGMIIFEKGDGSEKYFILSKIDE